MRLTILKCALVDHLLIYEHSSSTWLRLIVLIHPNLSDIVAEVVEDDEGFLENDFMASCEVGLEHNWAPIQMSWL